jgi:hypothetical protein
MHLNTPGAGNVAPIEQPAAAQAAGAQPAQPGAVDV